MKKDIPTRDIARRSLSAMGWNYLGAGSRVVAQLVLQIATARILGPQAFGQATAVMLVLGIGWLLAEGGFGRALIQKVEVSDNDVSFALGWIILTSSVIGLAIIVSSAGISGLLGDPSITNLLMLAGILVPVQCLANVSLSLMQRRLEMKRLQVMQLGSYVLCYGAIALPLAWFGMGALSLVVAFAAQSLLVLVLGYSHTRHNLKPTLTGDRKLLHFGLKISAINMSNWAIENLDRIVISRYWGSSTLGNYAIAANLSRAPVSLIVNSAQTVLFSSASRVQEDLPKLRKVYVSLVSLVLLLTIPIFGYLAWHAELVIHTFYGKQWDGAAPLFAAFCVSVPFYAVVAVSGPLLQAVGAATSELWVQMGAALIIVWGYLLFIGAPIATAVWLVPLVTALRACLLYRALSSKIGLAHMQMLKALSGGVTLGLCVVIVSLALDRLPISDIPAAILAGVIIIAISLIGIRIAPRQMLSEELSQLLIGQMADTKMIKILCFLIGLHKVHR